MAVTKFLRWDKAEQKAAEIYLKFANAWSWETRGEGFAEEWYPCQDIDGMYVAPYLGPPYEGPKGPIEEPREGKELRGNAEIVDIVEWPPDV